MHRGGQHARHDRKYRRLKPHARGVESTRISLTRRAFELSGARILGVFVARRHQLDSLPRGEACDGPGQLRNDEAVNVAARVAVIKVRGDPCL